MMSLAKGTTLLFCFFFKTRSLIYFKSMQLRNRQMEEMCRTRCGKGHRASTPSPSTPLPKFTNPELFINRTFHQLVSDFRAKVHHQGTTILLLLLESQVAIEVMKVWQECC